MSADRVGRDREDKSEYKVKMEFALTFSNKIKKSSIIIILAFS